MIALLIALAFIGYTLWVIAKKLDKLSDKGFFADKNRNYIPDGVDKVIDKVKGKKKDCPDCKE